MLHVPLPVDALLGLFADVPERALQTLQLQTVRRPGTPALELDDDGATASEEALDPSMSQPSKTVFFKVPPRMDLVRSGSRRRRSDVGAHEVIKAKVPKIAKNEDLLHLISEPARPYLSPSLTSSDILSEALKTYCHINDSHFSYLAEILKIDRFSSDDRLDMVLSDPRYKVRCKLGCSGED